MKLKKIFPFLETRILATFEVPGAGIKDNFTLEGLKMKHRDCGRGNAGIEFKRYPCDKSAVFISVKCERCGFSLETYVCAKLRAGIADEIAKGSSVCLRTSILPKAIRFVPETS